MYEKEKIGKIVNKEQSGFISAELDLAWWFVALETTLMSESGVSQCQVLSTSGPWQSFTSYK